jgi:cystathionine gamma-synthase
MRYAETLCERLGLDLEVHYCEDSAEIPPPAMLIDDTLIAPSDGVILSPEDIAEKLRDRLPEDDVTELGRLLEATQEQWMEEWSGD